MLNIYISAQKLYIYVIIHIQNKTTLMSEEKKVNRRNLVAKNPWHFVSPGEDSPRIVRALIQIPTGSKAKYQLDKESGLIKLDRVLFSSVHYPANYGFIPMTYGGDHDPLDILVISSISIEILALVDAKVIGNMRMIDQGELDDKIIAVANNDMSVNHYNNIEQLPQHIILQIRKFFEDYKKLQKKQVTVQQFQNREKAYEVINEAIRYYNETFITPEDIMEQAKSSTKIKSEKEKQIIQKQLKQAEKTAEKVQ